MSDIQLEYSDRTNSIQQLIKREQKDIKKGRWIEIDLESNHTKEFVLKHNVDVKVFSTSDKRWPADGLPLAEIGTFIKMEEIEKQYRPFDADIGEDNSEHLTIPLPNLNDSKKANRFIKEYVNSASREHLRKIVSEVDRFVFDWDEERGEKFVNEPEFESDTMKLKKKIYDTWQRKAEDSLSPRPISSYY